MARNAYNAEFGDRVAFWRATTTPRSHTGDRAEFVGRNRTLGAPAALFRDQLTGRTGAVSTRARPAARAGHRAWRVPLWRSSSGRTDRLHATELAARYATLNQVETALPRPSVSGTRR